MPRGNGGIIGPVNTSFSGVWSLTEAQLRRSGGTWPNFYAALLSESATGSDAVTGADTADPYFEYTTLLLPGSGTNGAQNNTFLDGSTNNFTITRNGNTTQGTFSPFSQTGWGNYFDGTGDYLSVPDNAAFTMGSGDFTIEFWAYTTTTTNNQTAIVQIDSGGSTSALSFGVQINTSKWRGILASGTTFYTCTASANAIANQWNHIAFVRNGNTGTLYINGTADGTVSLTGVTINDSSQVVAIGGEISGSNMITGYISNARIVKGVAVYTGNFTPPTSPLAATQSAGTNISAITGTQTSLLTCQSNRFIDNSTNNFTITRNGDTRVVAFSPFNPTASWSAATNGGSGYFDGSGDNVLTPSNTSFALSSDWTYEFWFYPISQSGSGGIVGFTDNIDNLDYTLSSNSLIYYNGSTTTTWSGVNPVVGAWNHIAIVKSSGTIRAYVNGNQSTNTASGPTTSSARSVYIGSNRVGTSTTICYIADFRIVKGTAVYTGAFTPPTAPITNAGSTSAASYPSTTNVNTSFASSATSLLLNFTNAGVYDATSKNDLETVGNAQLSNTTAKWGSTSIYMAAATANTDYLVMPASRNVQLGSGDFTIEFWMRPDSVTTSWANSNLATMLDLDPSAGTGTDWWFIHQVNNTVQFGSNAATILTSSASLVATTWQYIALVRSGSGSNNLTFYINGTASGSATYTATIGGNRRLFIGTQQGSSRWYKGYLQDIRITPGVARTITTPTAAFPTL